MFASTKLTINYAIFALIATAANIGAQEITIRSYDGRFSLLGALVVGTGVGLMVKYLLDKRYIFRFRARDVRHDSVTFALYTAMGLLTTLVFWGFEFAFHLAFEAREMRYVGGVLGLLIGYVTKYQLDKRYVFRTETA